MIYLDNSATTKPYPEVIDSFGQVAGNWFGNPSSIHDVGMQAEQLQERARKQAADLLNVKPEEIIFTSGGTESNNTAIKGVALEYQQRGNHIITTQIEHPSVLETCQALERLGFEVTYLPVNEKGLISLEKLEASITDKTILISVMHVNNELGTIQPIEAIGEIAKKYPKLFYHVDYVQGIGKVSLNIKDSGIDFCSVSGHKIHGLKGTGLLFIKKGIKLFPLLQGGGQEFSYRPGTGNVAGYVSLVKALRITMKIQREESERLFEMQEELRKKLEGIKDVVINSPSGHAPHILNISVPGYKPEVVIHALAKEGIYISTKSACSSKHPDKSVVLSACGLGSERSSSALRISLSYQNKLEEINEFCNVLKRTLRNLKGVMR